MHNLGGRRRLMFISIDARLRNDAEEGGCNRPSSAEQDGKSVDMDIALQKKRHWIWRGVTSECARITEKICHAARLALFAEL